MSTPTTLRQVPTVANMTLRDWFAGQALVGLAEEFSPIDAARYAYQHADEMLAAREVKP